MSPKDTDGMATSSSLSGSTLFANLICPKLRIKMIASLTYKFSIELPHDKTNNMGMCAQRRLRTAWASAQSDQSSMSAWRKFGSLATHWANSENSDQTGHMPRLIWVFAGHTVTLLVFSWGGSIIMSINSTVTINWATWENRSSGFATR